MKKYFIIFVFAFMLITAAFADETLFPPIGGGKVNLQSGNAGLWDMIAQPVVGESKSDNTKSVFWGSIYWDETIPAIPPGNDNGLIFHTWIEKAGNNVVLHWEYSDPNIASVDIWRLRTSINDSYRTYNIDGATWTKVADNVQMFSDAVMADIDHNYYYRAIPAGSAQNAGEIFGTFNNRLLNAQTVGKISVKIDLGYNLISIPLILTSAQAEDAVWHQDPRLQTALEGQSDSGDDFYAWEGNSLALSSRSGGLWLKRGAITDQTIDIGKGFWLNSRRAKTLSFVGIVPYTDYSDKIAAGLNLIGYPMPVTDVKITGDGFNTKSGDDFYYWDKTEKRLVLISNSNGWPNNSNLKSKIGVGNWYNLVDARDRSFINLDRYYKPGGNIPN